MARPAVTAGTGQARCNDRPRHNGTPVCAGECQSLCKISSRAFEIHNIEAEVPLSIGIVGVFGDFLPQPKRSNATLLQVLVHMARFPI